MYHTARLSRTVVPFGTGEVWYVWYPSFSCLAVGTLCQIIVTWSAGKEVLKSDLGIRPPRVSLKNIEMQPYSTVPKNHARYSEGLQNIQEGSIATAKKQKKLQITSTSIFEAVSQRMLLDSGNTSHRRSPQRGTCKLSAIPVSQTMKQSRARLQSVSLEVPKRQIDAD